MIYCAFVYMNKEILRLAVPNIISNISIPLLSSVDTLLMGHLSSLELGAVGIASMIFNFVYWNFGFLRMGTTGMTAQAYGKGDKEEISGMLQRSLLLSISIAVVIMLLMIPIASASSFLMNVASEQQPMVNQYFFTRIWAAPATLGLYALLGWFFGMQNARIPLLITIVINLINIVMSFYFVKVLDLGIKGVALGTVIAQYFGFILALVIIVYQFRNNIKIVPLKLLIAKEKISKFLNVNTDIFLRTVMLTFAFAFLYSQASLEGELFLAANVILLQFLNWMSYAIDGFAYAAESLVGKYHGAGSEKNTYKAINHLFRWGLGFAILFTLVFYFFGEEIVRLFSNQEEVVSKTNNMLVWVYILPLTSFACYIWDGIYIGLTASKSMRNTMVIAIAIYIATYYGVDYFFGLRNIWLAMIVFLAFRGILQSLYFARFKLDLP